MKKKIFYLAFLFSNVCVTGQTTGDLFIIGFNADGDDDLSFVTFSDINPNTIIYFTDREADGSGGLTSGEGTLIWNSGSRTIKAGTVIIFTDIDNGANSDFNSSVGTLSETGSFSLPSSSKDGIIVFTGADENSPSTFISAIQIGNDSSVLGPYDMDGITLSNTGLQIGVSIIVFDNSATPDGAVYNASRSSQTNFKDYFTQISDNTNNWTSVVNGDGESLLPFSQEAFTLNFSNWTGTMNSDWSEAGNWDNGIPSSSTSATVPNVANEPVINSGAEVGNLIINSGATLTIDNINDLSISGNLSVDGNLSLTSGSSLIVNGSTSGTLTYNRAIQTTNWYLISSPVEGQDIDAFASSEGLATGTNNNLGLGTYNNSIPGWEYYQDGSTGTGSFTNGSGRAILLSATGDISFTGTMNTSNVTVAMTSNSNGFNLVGNPFTSYIAANSNADGMNNILNINAANLTENTLWFWDQETNSYDQINQASSAFHIAPTQGFFVNATGSVNLHMTEAMQSHQSTDTFQRVNTQRPEIILAMTNGTDTRDADIYYFDGSTTGFDNGYDSSIFGGIVSNFAIYTNAVSDGTGKKLGIQSLPNNDFESMVIPVGIRATSGIEIMISARSSNLPSGINIYLEDKTDSSFTLLDSSSNFVTTLTEDLNGIGRFYLHTRNQPLSIDDSNLNNISIYQQGKNNLRIVGVQNGTATVRLYNVLGQQVVKSRFGGTGLNDITLPKLRRGVYIIQLETETGRLNKKVIIE